MTYQVYATRWDSPNIIEEMLPARDLEFSMPLNDHGQATFTATAEPGRSFWRQAINPFVSGLLVAKDDVPVWCGWVVSERETAPRTFQFTALEWGSWFERVGAHPGTWTSANDYDIMRDLISAAQADSSSDARVTYDLTSTSANSSDLTINVWDGRTAYSAIHEVSEQGGPDWYFGAGGTLSAPLRQFVFGDTLGHTTAETVLEYVEDTEDYAAPEAPPSVILLGDLFPAGTSASGNVGRRGGNVLEVARDRNSASSATQVIATGAGVEDAQIRYVTEATDLIASGRWPRLVRFAHNSDISHVSSLASWAQEQLDAARGLTTGYSLVTFDDEPRWRQTPRGSQVRVILDTDRYGAERPVGGDQGFTTRLLNTTVRVPDDGAAQVQWDVATVQEVP